MKKYSIKFILVGDGVCTGPYKLALSQRIIPGVENSFSRLKSTAFLRHIPENHTSQVLKSTASYVSLYAIQFEYTACKKERQTKTMLYRSEVHNLFGPRAAAYYF